jgi:hypothetical protein
MDTSRKKPAPPNASQEEKERGLLVKKRPIPLRRRMVEIDSTWLQETINDLREQGCDEEFIQCCIDELEDGNSVTVEFQDLPKR